jgi:hypothetical protein
MPGTWPKGHARVNASHPAAFAICDQCGFQYNHRDLIWEAQWMGKMIQQTGFLVCPTCWDVPNPQLQARGLPADPVPILNPRRERHNPMIDQTVYVVATLPSAVTSGDGFYTFVSDSTADNFPPYLGQVVVGGGSFTVPVVSDAADWRIG